MVWIRGQAPVRPMVHGWQSALSKRHGVARCVETRPVAKGGIQAEKLNLQACRQHHAAVHPGHSGDAVPRPTARLYPLADPTQCQPHPKDDQSQHQGGRQHRSQDRGHLGIGCTKQSFTPHQPDAHQDQAGQAQPIGASQPVGQRQGRQERRNR